MLLNETNWLLYNFKEKPKINENLIKSSIINPSTKANVKKSKFTYKFKTINSSTTFNSKAIHVNSKVSYDSTKIPKNINSTLSPKLTKITSSKIYSALSLSSMSTFITNNTSERRPCICATSNVNATAFNLIANHQNNNRYGQNGEEFTNIWKLAFFVLAFLMCFISLILILTFSIKIVISKMRKNSKFDIIDDQHLKNLKQLKSTCSSKNKNKTPPMSLFENKEINKSANKVNSINGQAKNLKNPTITSSSMVSLNKYADQITRHQNSINSNKSILMIKSGNTNLAPSLNKKSENSSQKRPPLPQMPPIFQLQNHHLGAPSLKVSTATSEENKQQRFSNENEVESDSFTNSNQNSQCFIYGIANKAFLGDDLNQSSTEKSGLCPSKSSENFVPSSFRPMTNQVSILNVNKIEIKSDLMNNRPSSTIEMSNTSLKSASASPREDTITYHHPWKLCTNDYEALEATHTHTNTNTGTSGSLGNLSGVTTYSEVFSESKILDCIENRSFTSNSHRNILCLNNNELISRSSKITQELELRLKERRQMMESNTGKFYPKILQQSDLTQSLHIPRTSSTSTHTTCSSNSSSSESSNDSAVIRKSINSFGDGSSSASQLSVSCVCPCHSHSHSHSHSQIHNHNHGHSHNHHHQQINNKNLNSSSDLLSTSQKCREHNNNSGSHLVITNNLPSAIKAKKNESLSSSNSSNPSPSIKKAPSNNTTRINVVTNTTKTNANKYKNPKIVLDGSATLPTKRESIRMLMENKAVTENKQKTALEMHLNTMIGIRASTNNLNSLNE